jgi:hypothetical protein
MGSAPVSKSAPHFGGNPFVNGVSFLLSNELANNFIVDGTIGYGRVHEARNLPEKLEKAFKELADVWIGIYFLTPLIQKLVVGAMDHLSGSFSHLEFKGLTYLINQYKTTHSLVQAYQSATMPSHAKFTPSSDEIAHFFNRKVSYQKAETLAREKKYALEIYEYIHQGRKDNVLLEMAKECGWIPTKKVNGRTVNDLTQLIKIDKIMDLEKSLDKMIKPAIEKGEKWLPKLLEKSLVAKSAVLIVANLLCSLYLAYLVPKVQHLITYKMTGKDEFPGIMNLSK